MKNTWNEPTNQNSGPASAAKDQGDSTTRSRPQSRRLTFDEQRNLVTANLSAYWIPELSVREVIHGTTYTVTGSYEGTTPFVRKLERIMTGSFSEGVEEPAEETADENLEENVDDHADENAKESANEMEE